MTQRLLARIDKLDTLSRRDRVSLLLGLLALLVGVEMLIVQPTHTKRRLIEQSASADSASQSETQARDVAARVAQRALLLTRVGEVQTQLAAIGLKDGAKGAQREALAVFLSRTLRNQGVVLVSTKGLPVEALNMNGSADDAAAAAAQPASAAEAVPALFRHRTELTLEGSIGDLSAALDVLERDFAPSRVERVRLAARGASGAIQASVVLTTINLDSSWLAL